MDLGKVYADQIWYLFKYHPEKDTVVPLLIEGALDVDQTEQAFEEANYYSWEHFWAQSGEQE